MCMYTYFYIYIHLHFLHIYIRIYIYTHTVLPVLRVFSDLHEKMVLNDSDLLGKPKNVCNTTTGRQELAVFVAMALILGTPKGPNFSCSQEYWNLRGRRKYTKERQRKREMFLSWFLRCWNSRDLTILFTSTFASLSRWSIIFLVRSRIIDILMCKWFRIWESWDFWNWREF